MKLYAKLLAQHLSTVIPQIIHPDQVGFVPGRQASVATRCFIDLIQWAEHNQMPSLFISPDAEKAFDIVESIGLTWRRYSVNLEFQEHFYRLY